MEKIIEIPEGTSIATKGFKIKVSAGDKNLEKDFTSPLFRNKVKLSVQENKFIVSTDSDKRRIKSQVGCIASHVKGMIKGLSEDYVYKMKIVFMHFPMTAKVEGDKLVITNFLGERKTREARILGDTKVVIKGDDVTVSGPSKLDTGQTAANIETASRITVRDKRVFQDGIYIVEKG